MSTKQEVNAIEAYEQVNIPPKEVIKMMQIMYIWLIKKNKENFIKQSSKDRKMRYWKIGKSGK